MNGGAAVLADAPVFFFVEIPCLRLIREDDLGANYRSFSDAGVDALDIRLLVALCLQQVRLNFGSSTANIVLAVCKCN
ncbi:hypothetical protein D3C74_60460 [compost metagenome]